MTEQNPSREQIVSQLVDIVNADESIDNLRGYAISMILKSELVAEATNYAYYSALKDCAPEEVPTMERFRDVYEKRYKENMAELALGLISRVLGGSRD